MKAVVAAFNQEKALVGAFSVITNLRMELFEALVGGGAGGVAAAGGPEAGGRAAAAAAQPRPAGQAASAPGVQPPARHREAAQCQDIRGRQEGDTGLCFKQK